MKFHEIFNKKIYLIFRLRPTTEWRTNFHAYLRTMPAYYAAPLRRVLTRMGAGNLANSLIPETMDNCLSYRYENIKFYGLHNILHNRQEIVLNVEPIYYMYIDKVFLMS